MPDKISKMNERRLVAKVKRQFTCHTCESKVMEEMKAQGMRYTAQDPIMVPYYWLKRVCPHYQNFLFQSVYEGVGRGEGTGSQGAPSPL